MTVYIVMQTEPFVDICAVYADEQTAEKERDRLQELADALEEALDCDPCWYESVAFTLQ